MPTQGPELRDVHVPHVSWWPLAPAWWVLVALVVLVILVGAWRLRRRARRRRQVDAVLETLHQARARHATDGDNAAFASTTHALLRRVARTRYPASVTFSARAWLDALSTLAPHQDVSRVAALHDAIYRPGVPLDVDAVAADIEDWVRAVMAKPVQREGGRV